MNKSIHKGILRVKNLYPALPAHYHLTNRPFVCPEPLYTKEQMYEFIDSFVRCTGHVTITENEEGECILVSRQDDDHKILSVIWEKK